MTMARSPIYLAIKTLAVLAALACGSFGHTKEALAFLQDKEKKILYDCPDLQEKSEKTGYGKIFQGYDGWFFKHNDFDENFVLSDQTKNYLKRLNAALAEQGITLVMVSPLLQKALMAYESLTPEQIARFDYNKDRILQDYESFVNQITGLGIVFPDIADELKKFNADNINRLVFKKDLHWTPEGAHFIARQLAGKIKELPAYDELDKVAVTSQQLGSSEYVSKMHEHLRTICTSAIPAEEINIYHFTRQEQGGETAESLFGATGAPPIALIGSSFSNVKDFGFRSFIEQETSLEVVNYAIAGGMLFTAIISYLNSDDFVQEKAPILLWEVAPRYDLNEEAPAHFRQIIPAVAGECSGEKIIGQTSISLEKDTEKITLLSGLDGKKINGQDYYLYIESENRAFNQFRLNFEYDDGDGDLFTIDHSGRYKNAGRFFIELSGDIGSSLSSVSLENNDDVGAELAVKLCRK